MIRLSLFLFLTIAGSAVISHESHEHHLHHPGDVLEHIEAPSEVVLHGEEKHLETH